MARNTGRGSRIAAASPAAGMFVEAKRQGGSFQTLPRRSWRRELRQRFMEPGEQWAAAFVMSLGHLEAGKKYRVNFGTGEVVEVEEEDVT